ncbi:hypothetical protein [Simiduia litorea]|uniref:hypothetical protein n=1 Tax=Simiduia litorea TaxID=1435348 RepID=UPI0036F26072
MNVEILEEFFGQALHESGSIYSLEFISSDLLYYIEVSPALNSLILTASNKDMVPSFPLFEFNLSCNKFSIQSKSNGVEELLVNLNDQDKNEISINKQDKVFWVSVEL